MSLWSPWLLLSPLPEGDAGADRTTLSGGELGLQTNNKGTVLGAKIVMPSLFQRTPLTTPQIGLEVTPSPVGRNSHPLTVCYIYHHIRESIDNIKDVQNEAGLKSGKRTRNAKTSPNKILK